MNFTIHAEEQVQKRGIPDTLVKLLYIYGKEQYDGHGGIIISFKKDVVNELSTEHKKYIGLVFKHLKAYIVESHDSVIITVGHITQRRKEKPKQRFSADFHLKKHFSIR